MGFKTDKLKQVARPMTAVERNEIESRNENRDWLALSAKFALLLRHILRTENLTQTELANRMGVSCAQITKILSGKENIGLQTIAKVEKALGRSLVTFRNHAEGSVFTSAQRTYTSVYTFQVYYPQNTSRVSSIPRMDTYTLLSDSKILV